MALITVLKSKRNLKQKRNTHPEGVIVNRARDEASRSRSDPPRATLPTAPRGRPLLTFIIFVALALFLLSRMALPAPSPVIPYLVVAGFT